MTTMRVANPPPGTHPSQEWADQQANPSTTYPGVYEIKATPAGGTTSHRIKPEWWDYTRKVNEYMGTMGGWVAGRRNNGGWINWAANKEWAQGEVLPENPDPLPIVEGVITIWNTVEILERKNNAARIAIFNYLDNPPDVSAVNPNTHPHLFDLFRSVNKAGDVGYAPDGKRFYFPRLAKNGVGWIPENILEDVNMPTNQFPLIRKGVAIHYLSQCFNGDVVRICDYIQFLGVQSVTLKVGNGTVKWTGLEPFILETRRRNISTLGYWYYYGFYASEGESSAQHAAYLADVGLQGLILDVEKEFDSSAGAWTVSNRLAIQKKLEPKAHAIGQALRKLNPKLPISLGSWRFPDQRPTPMNAFLQYCDANSPQVYSLGTGGPAPSVAANRIDEAIAAYRKPANGGWTGPTFPFVAAYHEGGNYVTVDQMSAVDARVRERGLPGEIWWWLPHLIERADWAAEVKSHPWLVNYTEIEPTPEPTDVEKLRLLWAAHPELH